MSWNPWYAILIVISTLVTWICGLVLGIINNKTDNNPIILKKKICVTVSLVINLGILAVFKYGNFFINSVDAIMNKLHISFHCSRLDLLLPVGISFYTFQALGYTIDVYQGKIKPEKNVLKYALFVSFFPQLVAGPIERSRNLLSQVQNVDKVNLWNYDRVRDGFFLMMWGLFQKLVIADRLAIIVNQVYDNYKEYGFVQIYIATIFFAFQIYCDFNGYSTIARGAAKVMGFELMYNFKQPYLATSIKDFWRRWHISLTTWFTDYLYIPLGGNRKGLINKYRNILIVFVISGLWHGASWNFVIWGLLHAIYQISEDLLYKKHRNNLTRQSKNVIIQMIKMATTFILVVFAWIFFRADNTSHAFSIVAQSVKMFSNGNYGFGMMRYELIIVLIAIGILGIVDILHEKSVSLFSWINRRNIAIRWILYQGIIWTIIMFGVYGTEFDASQFIYFQF